MVVNDLIVQGAEPLVFLDYLAMDRLDRQVAKQALRGIAEGCRRAGCALLGGETATMPDVYQKGDLEMVGFGVGVVERDKLIDGSSISQGDVILGLASSGIHSNGYSLVRRIVDAGIRAGSLDLRAENAELNTTLASALMAPTRIYVKPLLNVMRDFTLNGLVHITGGGFVGNVPRVLPKGVRARIDPTCLAAPGRLRPAAAPRRALGRRDAARLQLRPGNAGDRAARAGETTSASGSRRWASAATASARSKRRPRTSRPC